MYVEACLLPSLCAGSRSTSQLAMSVIQAAILDVPFVDVIATMSDPKLPLTVTEYEVRRAMQQFET